MMYLDQSRIFVQLLNSNSTMSRIRSIQFVSVGGVCLAVLYSLSTSELLKTKYNFNISKPTVDKNNNNNNNNDIFNNSDLIADTLLKKVSFPHKLFLTDTDFARINEGNDKEFYSTANYSQNISGKTVEQIRKYYRFTSKVLPML